MNKISWLRLSKAFGLSAIVFATSISSANYGVCWSDCIEIEFVKDEHFSTKLPKDIFPVVKSFLSRVAPTLDKPLNDTTSFESYEILGDFFASSFDSDFLFEKIIKKTQSEFNLKIDPNLLKKNPRSLEHAMAVAFFRENVFRLSIGILRTIRQEEISAIQDSFMNRDLKDKLLNNPLSFKVLEEGQIRTYDTGVTEYEIPVMLIPEVEKYGKSHTIHLIVRKNVKDSSYYIHDFLFGPGLGVRQSHISAMKSVIQKNSNSLDICQDIVSAQVVKDAMNRWGLNRERWQRFAEQFR